MGRTVKIDKELLEFFNSVIDYYGEGVINKIEPYFIDHYGWMYVEAADLDFFKYNDKYLDVELNKKEKLITIHYGINTITVRLIENGTINGREK